MTIRLSSILATERGDVEIATAEDAGAIDHALHGIRQRMRAGAEARRAPGQEMQA
jgi:hypothetical protein